MHHLWKWTPQIANEDGATIPLVAVCLAALIAVGAIAVDLGMLLNSRSEAQRAADAAALAGASVFMPPEVDPANLVSEATARAHEYGGYNFVLANRIQPEEMQVEVLTDEGKVRVTVTRSGIPLWFARIFGLETSTVAARAAAAVQQTGSVECLRPIAFADLWHERTGSELRYSGRTSSQPECAWGDSSCDYYNPTETGRGHWWRNAGVSGPEGKGQYEAPDKPNDVGRRLRFDLNDNSGNFAETSTERLYKNRFYPLRVPDCNGGDCWRQGLAGEICTGTVSIGDAVVTEPGAQVGPTNQGFKAAFDDDPGAYWDDATNTIQGSRYPLGCSGTACTGEGSRRIFNVAMVHPVSRILYNASGDFEIQNFGAFFLETWNASGSGSWVEVRWMKPKAVADKCRERGNCRSNLVIPLRLVE